MHHVVLIFFDPADIKLMISAHYLYGSYSLETFSVMDMWDRRCPGEVLKYLNFQCIQQVRHQQSPSTKYNMDEGVHFLLKSLAIPENM